MLITPDDFVPSRDLVLEDFSIAHVFLRDRLVQPTVSPGGIPWRFYREAGFHAARVHPVGLLGGQAHVAVALDDELADEHLPQGWLSAGLRQWFGRIDDLTLAIAMRAVQILEWDRTHRFCGACATPTEPVAHERSRRCPGCGLVTYPRISPAMMVLVRRGRQLLLGRGLTFPPGRYSALAGFLEAGETIEQAIHREVLEEVGVTVRNLRYFASQSWPFPNSLMIAFFADYAGGEIVIDANELADARWFDPQDLPQLPPPLSIARALIEAALAEP